jgi:hypothetical protein
VSYIFSSFPVHNFGLPFEVIPASFVYFTIAKNSRKPPRGMKFKVLCKNFAGCFSPHPSRGLVVVIRNFLSGGCLGT